MNLGLNNRTDLKILRDKMNKALATISDEVGISFNVGSMSYENDGTSATIKVGASAIGEDGKIVDKAAVEFEKYCDLVGLKPDDLGKPVVVGGKSFVVSGLNMKAKKYPVIARAPSGKSYKLSAAAVRTWLRGTAA